MVCYGCGIDLHGYQAYRSLFCSQCLNRRAVEEQTRTQARIAERQLELQREQLEQFEEQRELTESRQYTHAPVARPRKICRPYSVIRKQIDEGGGLPDPDELSTAYRTLYNNAVQLVVEKQNAGIGMLQRNLGITFTIASELVTEMEDQGVITPVDENLNRRILVS